jgi:hypothetical protein
MPQYEHLDRVRTLASSSQDDQLQYLPKDQVTERQDHERKHAASRRSPSGQSRTSAPVALFSNATGPLPVAGTATAQDPKLKDVRLDVNAVHRDATGLTTLTWTLTNNGSEVRDRVHVRRPRPPWHLRRADGIGRGAGRPGRQADLPDAARPTGRLPVHDAQQRQVGPGAGRERHLLHRLRATVRRRHRDRDLPGLHRSHERTGPITQARSKPHTFIRPRGRVVHSGQNPAGRHFGVCLRALRWSRFGHRRPQDQGRQARSVPSASARSGCPPTLGSPRSAWTGRPPGR